LIPYLLRRWFLLCLCVILVLGFTQSELLAPLAEMKWLRRAIVASVLLLMSLPMQFQALAQEIRRPWAALLATVVNYGLLPLVAWPVSFLLQGDFRNGLLIAAATPCTLASAAVWTRRAGGNDAVAMMVTIITNTSCFIITPLWLIAMTDRSPNTPQLGDMVIKLGLLVVIPIACGQLARACRPVGDWATRKKPALNIGAQVGVLLMILLGSVLAAQELATRNVSLSAMAPQFIAMIGAVVGVHLSMFVAAFNLAKLAGFERENRIAIGFSGSQKTLMVGLTIAIDYGGLTLLPMVAYHVCQLLVDTVIADRLNRK